MIVVAVIAAVVFVSLVLGVAYLASRGNLRALTALTHVPGRPGSWVFSTTLVVVYLGCGIVLPLALIIGNHDNSNKQVGGIRLTASMQAGRELFAEHCAVCHTLAADNAVGKIGPDLDTLRPSRALILHTLANGCLQKPASGGAQNNCLGYGTMPADIVQGKQARDVADFVSRIAGHA